MSNTFDVVIIGAGPAGLACALQAKKSGLSYIVLEKATIVNTIVGFPTSMKFFSTSELLELDNIPFTSLDPRPTRLEAVRYYTGLARNSGLNIVLHNRVTGFRRDDRGLLIVTAEKGEYEARSVVLATGYFDQTNKLGIEGEELPNVHHYYYEPFQFIDCDVAVIGGKNSAVEAALELYRNGARVRLIHRGEGLSSNVKYWIRPDIENRIASGEIQAHWNSEVTRITDSSITIRNNLNNEFTEIPNDIVFALIGYRPNVELFKMFGIPYDPETLIPAFHPETYATPSEGVYIAGSVACGCKTYNIFIENGRQHAEVVIQDINRSLRSVAV